MKRSKIRLLLVGLLVGLIGFVTLPVPSFASSVDPIGRPEANSLGQVVLSALAVNVIISAVIPIVTGLLTKLSLSSFVKGLFTIVLNAVNSLVLTATMADGTAVFSKETLIMFVLGVVVSLSTYAGIYKPAGLTSSLPSGKLGPNTGIG